MDLEQITTDLGVHYAEQKDAADALKEDKADFFKGATEDLETKPLARKTIGYTGQPDEFVGKQYPGWRLVSWDIESNTAIIEEDPAWQKFVYISNDGIVYQRGITQASPSLDDERIRNEDPDLWRRITVRPEEDVLIRYEHEAGGDITPMLIKSFIRDHQDEFARELLPMDKIASEDLEALEEYVVPGKLSTRLEPPRAVKPEDRDG